MRFLIEHWKGELSLAKSFLLNFFIGYIALVTLLVVTGHLFWPDGVSQAHFYIGIIVFSVWFVWALVGVSRSAIKILRDGSSTPIRKVFALLAVSIVVAVVGLSANDIRNLFF